MLHVPGAALRLQKLGLADAFIAGKASKVPIWRGGGKGFEGRHKLETSELIGYLMSSPGFVQVCKVALAVNGPVFDEHLQT
jgi:hypothetical protein